MSDLAAIPFQFTTAYDNTVSVGITFVNQLHMILIWKSVAKVPVVTGLYVVEELEESERESTEISQGRWWSSSESEKVAPLCRENHALTDPTRNLSL